VQVAYAIGVAEPVSIMVDTFGTSEIAPDKLEAMVRDVFDMRPAKEPMQWEGRVYNIDDGKVYDGSIIMKSDNELYIQGCFMLFCQGEEWLRQDVPDPPKLSKPAQPAQPARAR